MSEPSEDLVCLPWCPICRGAAALGATDPEAPQLRDQLGELQSQVVRATQALFEYYANNSPSGEAATVEEIPID